LNIAFIIGAFPSLPETFILNQITGLIDRGHSVYIFPKSKGEGICHNEISSYDLKSHSFYPVSPNHNILVRYLKAIPIIFPLIFKGNKQAVLCLNVFKFGRQALSLRIFYQALPFLNKNIDIIQVHYADYLDRAILLKKLGIKAPIVLMMHRYDLRKLIESNGKIYSENFKYVDKILAISNYSYKTFISHGVPEEKIIIHPVGVDTMKYKTITRSAKSTKEIIILSVGRLAQIKGHRYGLEAFSLLKKELVEFRILYRIVGYGPELENLNAIVSDLNLQEDVVFTGPRNKDELMIEYKNADIFLLPSMDEMTPVVIMEALASGLPVVATDVAAVSELVQRNESGFIVEPKNTKQMATCIKTLIENPGLRVDMGSKGRNFISRNYDIKVLNRKLEEIYLECLQK
jgi:colanic acid/amylovoran biosynthesis glycosyltransferase